MGTMNYTPAVVPHAGKIVLVILPLVTMAVLGICLSRRIMTIQSWKTLPFARWLIVAIYTDSILFVFFTSIITNGLGVNSSSIVCSWAILLCLVCYMTTKVMIYFFLVEKAYIVRGSRKPRMKDTLYLVNFFGMICPYLIVIVLNFIFRIAYIDETGQCIIGMKKISMIPLILFDFLVNVYLTILFIIPLRKLYSYQTGANTNLRTIAIRTFVGSCATLLSSIINLTILMLLEGEPGWVCLLCCNADILFSVLVLHWVTAMDSQNTSSAAYPQGPSTREVGISLSSKVRDTPPTPTTKNFNKKKVWENESKNGNQLGGTVTTVITGEHVGISKGSSTMLPMDRIVVRTDQIHEIELEDHTSRSEAGSRADTDYPERGSTEKIVG